LLTFTFVFVNIPVVGRDQSAVMRDQFSMRVVRGEDFFIGLLLDGGSHGNVPEGRKGQAVRIGGRPRELYGAAGFGRGKGEYGQNCDDVGGEDPNHKTDGTVGTVGSLAKNPEENAGFSRVPKDANGTLETNADVEEIVVHPHNGRLLVVSTKPILTSVRQGAGPHWRKAYWPSSEAAPLDGLFVSRANRTIHRRPGAAESEADA
jgi:hypothetical protein